MKKIFRNFVITAVMLMFMSAFVSTAGAASDPFVGNWTSTDTDGSY